MARQKAVKVSKCDSGNSGQSHSDISAAVEQPKESTTPLLIRDTPLAPFISAACEALLSEIESARGDLGRLFTLASGEQLSNSEEGALYHFKSDIGLPIPADSPVTVFVDKQEPCRGILVGLQDFDVFVSLTRDLGEVIPNAKLSSEPWFIWQALVSRLHELESAEAGDLQIPLALVNRISVEQKEDIEAAKKILPRLKTLANSLYPNKDQLASMQRCAGSSIHYVWGPPGTGKTANLAQVSATLINQGKRILVLAHANAAVDVAVLRIADAFEKTTELKQNRILRLGTPQIAEVRNRGDITPEDALRRTHPELVDRRFELDRRRTKLASMISSTFELEKKRSLGNELESVKKELDRVREEIRMAVANIVAEAKILCATLSRYIIDDQLLKWPADAILIDEASMAPFPAVLLAGILAHKQLIIFGDFRQLPPIVLSSKQVAREWMGRDAFEIAGITDSIDSGRDDPRVTLLSTQYRMSEQIAGLIGDLAYGGRLNTWEGVRERNISISRLSPFVDHSAILVDTSQLSPSCIREPRSGSFSRANPIHAALAFELADFLLKQECPRVAIVTPFRCQAKLISSFALENICRQKLRIATVHRFQGSESEAVIVDLVDSFPIKGASKLTGKDREVSLRLLNVALSRAKGKLLILMNGDFVRNFQFCGSILSKLRDRVNTYGVTWKVTTGEVAEHRSGSIEWYGDWKDCEKAATQTLARATRSFSINLPASLDYSPDFLCELQSASSRVQHALAFSNPEVAGLLENTPVNLRLLTRPAGFFLFADETQALVGGNNASGAFFRIDQKSAADFMRELLLGAAGLGPKAEIKHALDRLCGRCPDCGEFRRPYFATGSQWKLACRTGGHAEEALDTDTMRKLTAIYDLKCAKCGGAPILRKSRERLFLGCENYGGGCPGDFPTLEDLFEEN